MDTAALLPPALETARSHNLARMGAWVSTTRAAAEQSADPEAFLADRHDWLGRKLCALGEADCPPPFRGLTAFDLAEAQAALLRPLTAC